MSTSLPPGTPPPDAPSRLPISRLAAYGGPTLGLGYLLFFVQFYFLKFATDVLLLAPAVIGVAMMGAKLWDAVSDPLVGTWSDRTRSRLGRRRPWMLASLPVLLVSFAALWRRAEPPCCCSPSRRSPCESPRPPAAAGVPACGRRGETCWAPDTRGSSCWCGSSRTWAWVCSARWRRSSSSTCFEDRT